MTFNNVARSGGEWLRGDGPEADIVTSTRVRLARNSANYPFPTVASLEEKSIIEETLSKVILDSEIIKEANYTNLMTVSPVDRQFLVERHPAYYLFRRRLKKTFHGFPLGRDERVCGDGKNRQE